MDSLILVPLIPLIGFIINGFFGGRLPEKLVGIIASAAIGISFIISIRLLFHLLQLPPEDRYPGIVQNFFTWLTAGDFNLSFALLLDPLSAVMILVVTGVSFIIHIYSIGYMAGDRGIARYFSFLNLFVFFMLLLVMGSNYLILFIGWEGVGLCSYLLIGFWFEDKQKAIAGKKAFIVNRIGDFGFLIGMLLIFVTYQSFEFSEVFHRAGAWNWVPASTITAITILLFVGAAGKSAQIPLYIWLPDAMAGPTPVSALIHAATMVTAGVYMVARSNILYALSPTALLIVAVVGGLTALLAATIGIAQNDIKKVLAYSTVSQLGYMFLACGAGAFAAGIFHLMTHAFFKALLFLGSGSVIHAMHHHYHKIGNHKDDPQDMRNMGGLKNKLPITFWTFLLATLAISGIPGFSGFFSKDEILWKTFASGNTLLWVVGLITAGITAFYMFRLIYMTFYGDFKGGDTDEHIHESPPVMTLPLVVLGILAIVGGYIGMPHIFKVTNLFEGFLHPVFAQGQDILEHSGHHFLHSASTEWTLMIVSVVVAVIGIYIAFTFYRRKQEIPQAFVARNPKLHRVVYNKYYVDEIYRAAVIVPLVKVSDFMSDFLDEKIIDGLVNGTASFFKAIAGQLRKIQTGFVQNYALMMSIGIIIILGYLILK
ncbi:MAG: NADH-quinone oxidoreductase subunit L [candidate division Zixibacteria bacterium]|nr:NADH-quinone oxidoreductase subunit L [Candidatus Tariuqbacter arcticus]